jgi:hypothetical protein
MRLVRYLAGCGLAALLTAAAAPGISSAAPTEQLPPPPAPGAGWVAVQQPAWDPAQPWYGRTVVVQPNAAVSAAVPVTVLVPGSAPQSFVEPTFVDTWQQYVVPTLATVVPVNTLQNGIQVVQVEPNVVALAAPQFYCGFDATGTCQAMAAQLAASNPNFTLVTLNNGPLGPGVYVAYRT